MKRWRPENPWKFVAALALALWLLTGVGVAVRQYYVHHSQQDAAILDLNQRLNGVMNYLNQGIVNGSLPKPK